MERPLIDCNWRSILDGCTPLGTRKSRSSDCLASSGTTLIDWSGNSPIAYSLSHLVREQERVILSRGILAYVDRLIVRMIFIVWFLIYWDFASYFFHWVSYDHIVINSLWYCIFLVIYIYIYMPTIRSMMMLRLMHRVQSPPTSRRRQWRFRRISLMTIITSGVWSTSSKSSWPAPKCVHIILGEFLLFYHFVGLGFFYRGHVIKILLLYVVNLNFSD